MRSVPRRLGLALVILSMITAASSVASRAAAQAPEARTGYSGLPVPRFVALKKDMVYGRAGPDLDVIVIYRKRGLPVKVIAESRDNVWRRVEDHTGRKVWINRTMLAENKHAVTTRAGILFSEPTEEALPRALVEEGVMATLEGCEGSWCRIKTDDYRGWTEKTNLWGTL